MSDGLLPTVTIFRLQPGYYIWYPGWQEFAAKYQLDSSMVATITPRPAIGLLAVAAAAYLWFTLTNSELRGRALLASGAFALIETVWTTLATTDTATGATRFRAPALGTLGHSSFTQFWANVLYTPLLLDGFRAVVPDHPAVRIALFPLNVWLLEVIEVRGDFFGALGHESLPTVRPWSGAQYVCLLCLCWSCST